MFLAGFSSAESQGSFTEPLLKEFTPSGALEQKKKKSKSVGYKPKLECFAGYKPDLLACLNRCLSAIVNWVPNMKAFFIYVHFCQLGHLIQRSSYS